MKLHTKALSQSTSITIVWIAVMTIWSELSSSYKDFLKELTGHHWVSKGVISIILFILAYLVLSRLIKDKNTEKSTNTTIILVVVSGMAIGGFFIWHFLEK